MSYTLLEKFHTGSATDMNNDFQHVGAGSLLPRSGSLLEPTTGVYDLGSSAASWNNGFVNTINLGSGTVNRCMNMIAETTLTATTSSIEFTGLNGETDIIYEINAELVCNEITATMNLIFNGDSTTNNYGNQRLYATSTAYIAVRSTSITTGLFLGNNRYNTTTAVNHKLNMVLYANNSIKLGLLKSGGGIGGTYVGRIEMSGNVWNNSATLTSMKFFFNTTTAYFDPNTHIEIWAKR